MSLEGLFGGGQDGARIRAHSGGHPIEQKKSDWCRVPLCRGPPHKPLPVLNTTPQRETYFFNRIAGVFVFLHLIECRVQDARLIRACTTDHHGLQATDSPRHEPLARVYSPHIASPLHRSAILLLLGHHHSHGDPLNTAKSQHPIEATRSTPRRPRARKTEPPVPRPLPPPHSSSHGGAGYPAISTAQRFRLTSCMMRPGISPGEGCGRAHNARHAHSAPHCCLVTHRGAAGGAAVGATPRAGPETEHPSTCGW